jgi:hypothetical protein
VIADERKKIAERIKQLQPQASNRQIAKVLGTGKDTINRAVGANAPAQNEKANDSKADKTSGGANAPPLSGPVAFEVPEVTLQRLVEKHKRSDSLRVASIG